MYVDNVVRLGVELWRVAEGLKIGIFRGSYKTRNGTEPEVIDAQYGRGHWTRGQKLALIRTACPSVRTLISRSVAATKTGQAPAESHVKRMNC